MGHHTRAKEVYNLRRKLERMSFSDVNISVDTQDNEWENGKRAWLLNGNSDWHIVLQDDAIISDTFEYNVRKAIENIPEPTCISFYTGTTRPYRDRVITAVTRADRENASYLSGNSLHWGVCIAMPTKNIEQIITCVDTQRLKNIPYDTKIGSYFREHNVKVYYTNPSLADHNDQLGSIANPTFTGQRVAHNFIGEQIVDEWNNKVVDIGR